jgi:hypothetical protein
MFISHGACGVWIKNIYWQTHLKKCSTYVLNVLVAESRKIPSVLSLNSSVALWPNVAMASSVIRFLDHTRRTTVGMTPLDE